VDVDESNTGIGRADHEGRVGIWAPFHLIVGK